MSTPFDNASDTAVNEFLSSIERERRAETRMDARKLAALWRRAVKFAERVDNRKPKSFFDRDRSECISDETWERFASLVRDTVKDGEQVSEEQLRRIFDDAAQRAHYASVIG